jgi:hypothetical protein
VVLMYNKTMKGGRPTKDPKETLVAVRLSGRQVSILEKRARHDATGLSEALRRCVDEWAAAQSGRVKSATTVKQEGTKKQVAAGEPRLTRRRKRRPTN